MNFYEKTASILPRLTETEKSIFNYCIRNLRDVKGMSIRELANKLYVSTTTIFRFTKSLGYDGYNDFIEDIKNTEEESRKISIPDVVKFDNYKDSFLKNVAEAVNVISEDRIQKFLYILSKNPHIYIFGEGLSSEVAKYFQKLLMTIGYVAELPREEYEFLSLIRRVKQTDVIFILSYSGENQKVIGYVERILAIATPKIISFTKSDNNTIQNMSDLNFYVFADNIDYEGIDLTSRCGMVAIIELLVYRYLSRNA